MEYVKIANLLGDASNKTSKFKTRKWIEISDGSIGTYSLAVKSNSKLL